MPLWDRCNHLAWGLALELGPNIFHHNSGNMLCKLRQEQLGIAQCMHQEIHLDTQKVKGLAQAMVLELALVKALGAEDPEAKVLGANIAGNRFHCRSDKMSPTLGQWPNIVHKY